VESSLPRHEWLKALYFLVPGHECPGFITQLLRDKEVFIQAAIMIFVK